MLCNNGKPPSQISMVPVVDQQQHRVGLIRLHDIVRVDCDEYLSCNSGSLHQRFPGKPLVMIDDRPMVQWVMKQPKAAQL